MACTEGLAQQVELKRTFSLRISKKMYFVFFAKIACENIRKRRKMFTKIYNC